MCDFEIRSAARAISPDAQKETPTSQVGVSDVEQSSKRHGNDAMIDQKPGADLCHIKRWSAFEHRVDYLSRTNRALLTLQAEDIKEGEDLAKAAINTAKGQDLQILRSAQDVMASIDDGEVTS